MTDEVEIGTEKDDLNVDIVKLYITDEKPTKSGQIWLKNHLLGHEKVDIETKKEVLEVFMFRLNIPD